jgi:RNA polymerase sigma-70 factor (ECF subfamily)
MLVYLLLIDNDEDKNKFELLYEKYRKLMFYVANNILHDTYLAEDAVHHAFLNLIDHLDKIDEVDCHKTKSFIVTIVRNHSINIYNQRKRHPLIPIEEIESACAEDLYQSVEEQDILVATILKLPIIYKDVLTLKYVQEYSNLEIARILGITEVTVRKRLERAKSKMKQILKEGDLMDEH